MAGNFRGKIARIISRIPSPSISEEQIPTLNEVRLLKTPYNKINLKSSIASPPDYLLCEAMISSDRLFSIPQVLTETALLALKEPKQFKPRRIITEKISVSDNMFRPLPIPIPLGKRYKETKQQASQQNLFAELAEDTGVRPISKAWSQKKTGQNSYSIKRLDIWDLIHPILLPPLELNITEEIDFPEGCEPYPYQRTGIEFLMEHPEALLADETGTGKTVMTSVALRIHFRKGKIKKCLIVCPPVALNVWDDHLFRWAPELRVTVVRGTQEVREYDWKYPAHIYLTTYETLRSDLSAEIKRKKTFKCPECGILLNFPKKVNLPGHELPDYQCPECNAYLYKDDLPFKPSLLNRDSIKEFDIVVLDEAQRIKNPNAQRSRAVKKTNPKWRWALTAFPLENKLDDLVAIFEFIKPNYLKVEGLSPASASELIKPYTLRRTKKEVRPDMPDKIHSEIWLDLDEEQRGVYDACEARGRHELEELGEKVTKWHIFRVIQKLKQTCNFPPGIKRSPKTGELLQKLSEITEQGKKVLVFSQYAKEGIEKLEQMLGQKKFRFVTYKGGMSDKQRKNIEAEFKTNNDILVFLGALGAAGEALNLKVATYVIHFDHWWNPVRMWNAEDRAYRITQDETVNVYSFWMKNTIEARIHKKLQEKGLLFQKVVGGLSEEMIDEFISTEEWLEILGVKVKKKPVEKAKVELSLAKVFEILETIEPLRFEETVKNLFYRLGFQNARTTKRSHDGGIDILASRPIAGGIEKAVAQCKRMPKVGVEHARALLGVVAADPTISKAYLVTSGTASIECKAFCDRDGRLVLIEGPRLARYINQFGIEIM